jgi:hypothetical protein
MTRSLTPVEPSMDTATNLLSPYATPYQLLSTGFVCEVQVIASADDMMRLFTPVDETATKSPLPYVMLRHTLSAGVARNTHPLPFGLVMARSPVPDANTATKSPLPYVMLLMSKFNENVLVHVTPLS